MLATRRTAAVADVLEPEQRPGRKKVVRKRHRRVHGKGVSTGKVRRVVATGLIVVSLLLVLGVRQASITTLGYQVENDKRYLEQLRREQAALEATLAGLANPARVERGALAMGMTEPTEVRLAEIAPLPRITAEPAAGKTAVVRLPQAATVTTTDHAQAPVEPSGVLALLSDRLFSWLAADSEARAGTRH